MQATHRTWIDKQIGECERLLQRLYEEKNERVKQMTKDCVEQPTVDKAQQKVFEKEVYNMKRRVYQRKHYERDLTDKIKLDARRNYSQQYYQVNLKKKPEPLKPATSFYLAL